MLSKNSGRIGNCRVSTIASPRSTSSNVLVMTDSLLTNVLAKISPCAGKPALMHAAVNKERCRPREFACIYLWISVVRTIRQWTGERQGASDSLGLLEYIRRYWAKGKGEPRRRRSQHH